MNTAYRALLIVVMITLCGVLAVRERMRGNELSYRLNRSVAELKSAAREQRDLRFESAAQLTPDRVLASAARLKIPVNARTSAVVVSAGEIRMRRILDEVSREKSPKSIMAAGKP